MRAIIGLTISPPEETSSSSSSSRIMNINCLLGKALHVSALQEVLILSSSPSSPLPPSAHSTLFWIEFQYFHVGEAGLVKMWLPLWLSERERKWIDNSPNWFRAEGILYARLYVLRSYSWRDGGTVYCSWCWYNVRKIAFSRPCSRLIEWACTRWCQILRRNRGQGPNTMVMV